MNHTIRPNVRGWKKLPVRASGHHWVGVKDTELVTQVNRWTAVSTITIVAAFLALLGYFDSLTGYWLGAVLGRLLISGLVLVVLSACVLAKNGTEPNR